MCNLDVSGKNNKTGGKGKMNGKEKISVKALRVVERIARNEVEKVRCGWPQFALESVINRKDRSGKKIKI